MSEVVRVTPDKIYPRVRSGECLLVCAYDSDEAFRSMHLEGAISLQEFRDRVASLPKDREIVFYCA
ncbi:MAG: hypothetical protein K6T55_06195 [Syntrophobacterales bacterium]|nr:hypothetical protein [Syntrophobacterales bacterium]